MGAAAVNEAVAHGHSVPVFDGVLQDLRVVEGKFPRKSVSWKSSRFLRVVRTPWLALGPADKNDRNRMATWVATGIGINMKLANELDLERRFLPRLPLRGLLHRFTLVHKSPGERPSEWWVLSTHEYDIPCPAHLDHDIYRKLGLSIFAQFSL